MNPSEWHELRRQCLTGNYASEKLDNQFYHRLAQVMQDQSTATSSDALLAYRDALLASPHPKEASLRISDEKIRGRDPSEFGLIVDAVGQVALNDTDQFSELGLENVYQLLERRCLELVPIDPCVGAMFGEPYENYNGKAQQLAVRLAITEPRNTTLIVNLPTGCGKTLVAHAIALLEREREFHTTIVVVPTIALAIELGTRTLSLMNQHRPGVGLYHWDGQQTETQHADLKTRIGNGTQGMLFCSPEAFCTGLRATLFQAVKRGMIGTVVVDEAHLVDHWGADFRPYFQIMSAMIRSLRSVSTSGGIKCILMSATFTEQSLKVLETSFEVEGQKTKHINGSFLRPEIQYAVREVSSEHHRQLVKKAIVSLPKPLIVYTNTPYEAKELYCLIKELDVSRVGVLTGETLNADREKLLQSWARDELDIMVGTSAFGLGVDKADVRSVLHATIPENLDRFYQEVGRAGRDGRACQSLLIFHRKQFEQALKQNKQQLISVELGLENWMAMWKHGRDFQKGKIVDVSIKRDRQRKSNEGYIQWKWKTLLLMQRAGMIDVSFEEAIDDEGAESSQENVDPEARFVEVWVRPLIDDHQNPKAWDTLTRSERRKEQFLSNLGYERLRKWLNDPNEIALCKLLLEHYTIDGTKPDEACGGCPHCRSKGREPLTPTLATDTTLSPGTPDPINPTFTALYFDHAEQSLGALVRVLARDFVGKFVSRGSTKKIVSTADVLNLLQTEIKGLTGGVFWIGESVLQHDESAHIWPTLIFHLDANEPLTEFDPYTHNTTVIAPKELKDRNNPNRYWWQSFNRAQSIRDYVANVRYVNN